MLQSFFLVGLGGAIGSMARYGIGVWMGRHISHPYPFATFTVNVLGCFIIGLLAGYGQKNNMMQGDWWLVLATGFCGGFTTFSSFAMENTGLLRTGNNSIAWLYIGLSILAGLMVCRAGTWIMMR